MHGLLDQVECPLTYPMSEYTSSLFVQAAWHPASKPTNTSSLTINFNTGRPITVFFPFGTQTTQTGRHRITPSAPLQPACLSRI